MRIFSFLIAAALASIGYAIVSAGDIVTSLDSIAKQISEADAQAKSSTTLDLITGSIRITSPWAEAVNMESNGATQLSDAQGSSEYEAQEQDQICSAYKSCVQTHQTFLETLIAKQLNIRSVGLAPEYSTRISLDKEAHGEFSTGISRVVPNCAQDVDDALKAIDLVFDQANTAYAA